MAKKENNHLTIVNKFVLNLPSLIMVNLILMKRIFLHIIISILTISSIFAQSFDPLIQEKVDELSYDSLLLNLQEFEDLGIKNIYSEELKEAASWIINKYEYWGYDIIEIDTFYYSGQTLFNIVVTKTGTLYPDQFVIIDGHYDTYGGPGANDNGTGTAIVLETARMMKDMQTDYSVKFIHFSAEEVGLVGSYHYVDNTAVPENLDIRLVFNIDEVGGVAGETNNTLTCERDESSPNGNNAASAAFTDTLANLTEMYSALTSYISYAYGSDYVPFMSNGFVVTGYYEYNESPYPHSIHDSISNLDLDYVFEVTKSSLAASLYFTGAKDVNTEVIANSVDNVDFNIYPNPFETYFNVQNDFNQALNITIVDAHGKVVKAIRLMENSNSHIDVSSGNSILFYIITDDDGNQYDYGKILKL